MAVERKLDQWQKQAALAVADTQANVIANPENLQHVVDATFAVLEADALGVPARRIKAELEMAERIAELEN